MLRKLLTWVYLLLYALTILYMSALVVERADPSGFFNKTVLILGAIGGALLLVSVAGFLAVGRRFPMTVWVGISIWSAFLIWFAWFSDGSPFILHEVHSFDPIQVAAERHQFRNVAVPSFSIMLLWFWSFILFWRRERR